MNLKETLRNHHIVMVTSSKQNYASAMKHIQEEMLNGGGKTGYITANKPYDTLHKDFSARGVDMENIFFIDAITATVQTPPEIDNCIFVNSPSALTDMALAFSTIFSEKGCDIVLFDTISTLVVYQDPVSVVKFVHNLVTKARVLQKKAVFIALNEDSETLIKDLNMFMDAVVHLE